MRHRILYFAHAYDDIWSLGTYGMQYLPVQYLHIARFVASYDASWEGGATGP
jgi:hypothetical protein